MERVNRYRGVYKRKTSRGDAIFYITLKEPETGRKIWEKVGAKSEGYTPQIAADLRSERVRELRHTGEVKTAKEKRRDQEKANKTVNEIAEHYFNSERGRAIRGRKRDMDRYQHDIEKVVGKKRVASLSQLDVERIKRNMKGKAPATIKNALELFRRLLRYGAKVGLCPPAGFEVEYPRVDNQKVEFLNPEELQRLMNTLETWPTKEAPRMIKLALFTGMRRGEIFRLKDNDINYTHRLITLRNPKGGRTVSIPLSLAAEEIIKAQQEERNRLYPGSPFLFPGMNGKQRKACKAAERIKAAAKLPKDFRPFHGLRHHFAVTLANSGEVSLEMISELLTHKTIEMTRRYGQFLPKTKLDAANLASRLVGI